MRAEPFYSRVFKQCFMTPVKRLPLNEVLQHELVAPLHKGIFSEATLHPGIREVVVEVRGRKLFLDNRAELKRRLCELCSGKQAPGGVMRVANHEKGVSVLVREAVKRPSRP